MTAVATTKHETPAQADATDLGNAAMVLRADPATAFKLALEPDNFGDMWKLAEIVAATRFCGISTTEEAVIRMMTGRSLAMPAMAALRGIYTIEGKPSLDASVMHALCLQSPLCEQFECVESTDEVAVYRVKRRGQEAKDVAFTVEEAEKALLLNRGATDEKQAKSNWNRWRAPMLRARAKSNAARQVFPDVILGMYSGEELRDGSLTVQVRHDELTGEVVTKAAPDVKVAERDFDGEFNVLTDRMADAETGAEMKAARTAIEAWDGPSDQRVELLKAYNAKAARMREAKAKAQAIANGTASGATVKAAAPTAPASEPKAAAERQPGEEG